jgi:hypothetical protein
LCLAFKSARAPPIPARMTRVPSIKATGFQSVSDDLARLISSGRISREQVEARLPAEDLRYLSKPLAATTWVPMTTHARALAILVELEANGDPEGYLHLRGVRAGERLHKAGLYRQFEASSETWGDRVGKIVMTMATVLYNFTRWSFESRGEPGLFQITVDDAADFSEAARFVSQGFTEYAARVITRGKEQVRSERPSPNRIVFRSERPPR